jgi:hypothetical protein
MAVDVQPPTRLHTLEPDPPADDSLDAFFKTPEGQCGKAILDAIEMGDTEEAQRIYEVGRAKFGWVPRGGRCNAALLHE